MLQNLTKTASCDSHYSTKGEIFASPKQSQHKTPTVIDDSLIFCSTISRAVNPSSRKGNSNAVGAAVFMVTRSPFDYSLVNWKREGEA